MEALAAVEAETKASYVSPASMGTTGRTIGNIRSEPVDRELGAATAIALENPRTTRRNPCVW